MRSNGRYNILHLIPLFEIGGLQRQIANWVVRDYTGNCHGLGILNYSTEGLVLFEKKVPVLFNGKSQCPENTRNLVEFLDRDGVPIIVAHNGAAWDKAVAMVQEFPSCRLFFVAHGRDLRCQHEDQSQFLSRLRYNSAFTEKMICTSKFLESMVRSFLPGAGNKIVRVYNGVAAPSPDNMVTRRQAKDELGIPSHRFLIGTVTRLASDKNLEFLIRAVDRLVEQGKKDIQLLILGNGKDEASLRNHIRRLRLEEYVFLQPGNENVGGYYSAFDLYVNCSLFESCSMAILEAMSYGLPVLASMVGGNGELIVDGEVGCLYPADDLEAFLEKFDELYRSPELRRQLGSRAQEYVRENFGLEKMMDKYQNVFGNFQCV
jgi:glycosyltransferase involved in cell wall biosynthesis